MEQCIFQISAERHRTQQKRGEICFEGGRGRRGADRNRVSTRARAKERAEGAKAMRTREPRANERAEWAKAMKTANQHKKKLRGRNPSTIIIVMQYVTGHCRTKKKRRCCTFFFFQHLYFPASGQTVDTGVVPSSPRFLISIYIAHRVQKSHCSSTFIECCQLKLSRFPQVNLCARKSPHEYIGASTRGDSISQN